MFPVLRRENNLIDAVPIVTASYSPDRQVREEALHVLGGKLVGWLATGIGLELARPVHVGLRSPWRVVAEPDRVPQSVQFLDPGRAGSPLRRRNPGLRCEASVLPGRPRRMAGGSGGRTGIGSGP